MNEELPDWLRDIAPEDDEDDLDILGPDMVVEEESSEDLMTSLRTGLQGSDADEEADAVSTSRRSGGGAGIFDFLFPWQRFILSVFLFLDILVIGLLFLTVLGRIAFF